MAFSFSAVLCSMTAVSIRSPCPRNSGEFIPGSSRKNVGVGAGEAEGAAAGVAAGVVASGDASTVDSPLVASVIFGLPGTVAAAADGCASALVAGSDDDAGKGLGWESAEEPTSVPPAGL